MCRRSSMIVTAGILFFAVLSLSFAQDKTVNGNTGTQTGTEVSKNAPDKSPVKVEAVLPQSNPDIIFVEGEDAVSTNFNREPILNYSCSDYRTLQLNETNDPPPGSSYFADFVFYVENDGDYELYYGGTPPGNKDDMLPSYSSPFTMTLDKYYTSTIYREDMHVIGNYTPAYYWNYVKDITLSKGEHRLRFEIPSRRNYDNKYFFYLDNFFLIRKVNGKRVLTKPLPAVFPKNLGDRSMDRPFKSIEDYQIAIRDKPEESQNYVELSLVYSLIGDYLHALKNLRKALLLEPDDPDLKLLVAKNLIWKGSFSDGLAEYKDLLMIVPENLDYWSEAGKIAAWIGQYDDSVEFFKNGLKEFPDNLGLLANLGITYLWNSKEPEAEKIFKKLDSIVEDDVKKAEDLGKIFLVNGYPGKAVEVYDKAIKSHPEFLELYFLLEKAYIDAGKRDKIPPLRDKIDKTFIKTPDFEKVLENFYNKEKMKDNILHQYETDLSNDPDNLVLRKTLAEMYFWNGYKDKAISEYLNILTNYNYSNLRETRKELSPFYELLDKSYLLYHFIRELPSYFDKSRKELTGAYRKYTSAQKKAASLKQKNEKLKAAGKEIKTDELSAAEKEVETTGDELASLISSKEAFLEKLDSIKNQLPDDSKYLTSLLEDGKAKTDAFKKLTKGSNWQWDKSGMLQELEEVKSMGLVLANYDLGIISQMEGDLPSAEENLKSIPSRDIVKGDSYALFQTELWMGKLDAGRAVYGESKDSIEKSADYIPDLVNYMDYLTLKDEEIVGFLTGDPGSDVKNILDRYSKVNSELKGFNRDVEKNLVILKKFIRQRIIQSFYSLAEKTYLLRNELGGFYQNNKDYGKAIYQYKQVLAIDPWDISAKYKLGQVYDWNGNWSKAMKLYNEVYADDPLYRNVTANYNNLAREHADHLAFSGSTFADPTIISNVGNIKYKLNIAGIIGASVDYTTRYSMYLPLTAKDSPVTSPYTPASFTQSVAFGVPVSFTKLDVTPRVGVSFPSSLGTDSSRSNFLGNPSMLNLVSSFSPYIFWDAAGNISIGSFTINSSYKRKWIDETFKPGVDPVFSDTVDGTVQLDFGFTGKPVIKNTGAYLSGYGSLVEDGNILYGTSAGINNYFKVTSKPDISMGVDGSFSWNGSNDSALKGSAADYWYSKGDYTAGAALTLNIGVMSTDKLDFSDKVYFYSGYYSENKGETNDKGASFELSNTFNYRKNDFSGYLKMSASLKPSSVPQYWSFTIELGADAGLADLLSL